MEGRYCIDSSVAHSLRGTSTGFSIIRNTVCVCVCLARAVDLVSFVILSACVRVLACACVSVRMFVCVNSAGCQYRDDLALRTHTHTHTHARTHTRTQTDRQTNEHTHTYKQTRKHTHTVGEGETYRFCKGLNTATFQPLIDLRVCHLFRYM